MRLEVLLPFKVFADVPDVLRVIADTAAGSLGLLPHRLDCAVALRPGILTYETAAAGAVYIAVDAGVLVKTGTAVLVAVRQAVGGADLETLQDAVANEFLELDAAQRQARAASARIESAFMRRIVGLGHERR
ncbi:F0F1 ATP synthase subunit epsilon [Salinisphaera sp. RV14]|uniref:F0F1 ATP synthase subunit epsilon n=1 Tax=unclassified Salinisphaera TaxID=2649847 RepID=UPI003F824A7F